MSEIGETPIDLQQSVKPVLLKEDRSVLQPIGDRTLGSVDPRTLSEEEFGRSSDLLFHGAEEDFTLSEDTDYQTFTGPYSATVGNGFYTTDDRGNAKTYSLLRRGQDEKPIVLSVLPYQAKVLDLRAATDPRVNAPVPADFSSEYTDYINKLYASKFPEGYTPDISIRPVPTEISLYFSLNEYRSTLRRLLRESKEGKLIELRQMLSLKGETADSEYAGGFFTQFMLGKGYDGLVYNEGGDHPDQKNTTSYVFYNLKKVGTFDMWQSRKSSAAVAK